MSVFNKKVCLLGDFAVGKTSLVRRFVYDIFDDTYIVTIGVKVSRKSVVTQHNGDIAEVNMMLWDLAGGEEFNQVRASYLRGSAGAVLVCDLTRSASLDSIKQYATELLGINPQARFAIAANKKDLTDQIDISLPQIEQVAHDLQAPYCLTSARTGLEVSGLFHLLAQRLIA